MSAMPADVSARVDRAGVPVFRAMSSDTGTEPAGDGAGSGVRAVTGRTLGLLASLVRIITVVFAAVLIIHLVLVVTSANPLNGVAEFLAAAADHLTLGLGDLFAPSTPALGVTLNYGLPALAWLIIGLIISRLLDALAP
jgi:hypothetical protein